MRYRVGLAALVVTLGAAHGAFAQTVTITNTNYQPAQPPVRPQDTTQPGGTFTRPGRPTNPWGPHRVLCEYGEMKNGLFEAYTNTGCNATHWSQVVSPGMGGTFNWGTLGSVGWTTPPIAASKVRAQLRERVAYTGDPFTDWKARAEDIKPVP